MEVIRLLPDDVINKIAAGEVVERPVSVIKELVENSIDAGSTMVKVELEEGGISRMTVTDNGVGMSPEDAKTALKRHATSKIHSADDLFAIETMGFRGEALASIASVSEFSLMTRQQGQKSGTKVVYQSECVNSEPWKGEFGTTINIEKLFHNIPVRQRFLKAGATEFSHCLEYLQAAALSNPFVGFELVHNAKTVFKVEPCEKDSQVDAPLFGEKVLSKRALDVLGEKHANELFYVTKNDKFGTLEALVSPPGVEKPNGKYLFSFVNGRWVKDKTVRFGIMRGYHSHLLKGKYPVVVLNFHTDPSLVDVNVHPSKTELRFQYTSEVSALIAVAIREGIRKADWATEGQRYDVSLNRHNEQTPSREVTSVFSSPAPSQPSLSLNSYMNSDRYMNVSNENRQVSSNASHTFRDDFHSESDVSKVEQTSEIPWAELRYLGSFSKCFLFFETPNDNIIVIDQHAFHERVLYERLTKNVKLLEKAQPLLVPESIELSASDLEVLKDKQSGLESLGFSFDFVSETTVELGKIPAILARANLQKLVESFCSELSAADSFEESSPISQLLLATIACHAAVRAGEELGENELKYLLDEAETVDFYHNCPHGRRVFRTFTKSQVSGWFDR